MAEFLEMMGSWDQYRPVSQSRVSEAALCRFVDLLSNRDRMPPCADLPECRRGKGIFEDRDLEKSSMRA